MKKITFLFAFTSILLACNTDDDLRFEELNFKSIAPIPTPELEKECANRWDCTKIDITDDTIQFKSPDLTNIKEFKDNNRIY